MQVTRQNVVLISAAHRDRGSICKLQTLVGGGGESVSVTGTGTGTLTLRFFEIVIPYRGEDLSGHYHWLCCTKCTGQYNVLQ
jgi:hypothetical protein